MTTTDLLGTFRLEVYDTVTPYLWSDALVYTYLDDAQKQFCRLTFGIEDSRSFSLAIVPPTEWYGIDPAILQIRSVIDNATGNNVPIIPVEKMANLGYKFDGTTGPTKAIITGLDKGFVRTYPVPNAPMTLSLRTFRLSADVAAGDDFEIDAQHLLPLLMWVKYKAYSVQDSDARDDKKAAAFKAEFEAYCYVAKAEQTRMRRPVSVVSYGGC